MTQEQEQTLVDLQRHSALHDARISNLETKFEMFMGEMRDRDNQRHAEIAEIRQSIKEIYQTTDAKISKIESKIDALSKHIQNMAIAAVVGVGAIVAAVVSIMKP